jgi:hypothetical protein
MNFALLAQSSALVPIRFLMRWIHSCLIGKSNASPLAQAYRSPSTDKPVLYAAHSARYANRSISVIKPLRVVRVLEAGQARSAVGRMLISGRMADVCAELDRLAEGEAARS